MKIAKADSPLHPDMQILLDARHRAGPMGDTTSEQRTFWTAYTKHLNRPAPDDMQVNDVSITTPDANIAVRLYRPGRCLGLAPIIVYLHGGGFMLGDLDSSDAIAWGLAENAGAVVASVDYRLTPEHVYPAALDDAWHSLQWLLEHSDELSLTDSTLLIVGDSAGGNLAAALALKSRELGGPRIQAVAIVYPATSLDAELPSCHEYALGPGLTREAMIKYRRLYLAGNSHDNDPFAVPATATDFSGLPPFWVHTAERDPIRDDGRVFASKLAAAGVNVTYREARGMIHGFMRARFEGAGARREYNLLCDFLRSYL